MHRRMAIIVAGMAAIVVLGAACSKTTEVNQPTASTSGSPSTVATTPAGQSSAAPATTAAPKSGTAHVGATLSLTGADGQSKADITLSQIIDPATGSDGPPTDDSGNPNGDSYVAALMTIKNTGSNPISGDANGDASLIGSNDQTYTADFDDVTECTNFDSGSYQLGPGESATGCVVYVLPPGVTPAKFQYSPTDGIASDFGEWLIP